MKGKTKTTKKAVKKAATKRDSLVCVPCGRELVVSNWGISDQIIYCCGKPMEKRK